MSVRLLSPLLCALAVLCAAGVAPVRAQNVPGATMSGDPARPDAARWMRTELYYAIGLADSDDPQRDAARWQRYLDEVVTPAFPDGFTVLDAYGQWLSRGADAPIGLETRVVVILHEDSPDARARVDGLRSTWKRLSGDQSVLRVTQPVEVSF